MHDWPTGSSRANDPRLARGCRCNVSRLVTYSVSSAGMGAHKVCMVSMGIVKRCPIGLGLSSILAYRAWVYDDLRRNRTATILQKHPSPPRCCLISLTLSLPVTTQTLLHLSSRSLPSILCRHSSPTHITENLWLWLADLTDCRSLPFTPSPCSFFRHPPRHFITLILSANPGIPISTLATD
jgi:hypothetical protein